MPILLLICSPADLQDLRSDFFFDDSKERLPAVSLEDGSPIFC